MSSPSDSDNEDYTRHNISPQTPTIHRIPVDSSLSAVKNSHGELEFFNHENKLNANDQLRRTHTNLASFSIASNRSKPPQYHHVGSGEMVSLKNVHGSRYAHIISKYWITEIISWILALLLFIAIICTLAAFDGKNIPHWKYGITLGALVSLFATIAGFVLMIPMGSAMGQLKWNWFRNVRPVTDFGTIDKASHGPSGSILLLIRRRGGPIATIGAILTILQLANGPFIQQIIQYEEKPVNVTQASIPVALTYDTLGNILGFGEEAVLDTDFSMKAAVMNGLLDFGAASSDFDVSPFCPTGNCTFPEYQSLGVCSYCNDLTTQLEGTIYDIDSEDPGMNWTLPNGLSLFVEDYRSKGGLITMLMTNSGSNESLKSVSWPTNNTDQALLMDFFVIVGPSDYAKSFPRVTTGPFAAECLLGACVQSYVASETNGAFEENVVGTPEILLTEDIMGAGNYTLENFSLSFYSFRAISVFLANTFYGTIYEEDSLGPEVIFTVPATQAIFLAMNNTAYTLDSVMGNVVKSMTRNIRTRADAGPPIIGNALSNQLFIRIKWVGYRCLPRCW